MTKQGTNRAQSNDVVDKDALHGVYRDSVQEDQKLRREIVRMANDMPSGAVDDMDNSRTTTVTKSGISWKELAVVGATLLGGGALWSGLIMPAMSKLNQAAPAITAPAEVVEPLPVTQPEPIERKETITRTEEVEFLFFDEQGNPIHVERWPGTGQKKTAEVTFPRP